MRRLRRALRPRGSVAIEFIIAIIPFLMILTGVIQLALISVAKLTVHYAAVCATRAAIVVLPENEELGRDVNTENIRDAAVYAILPIAPAISANSTLIESFGQGGGWNEASKNTGIIIQQGMFGTDTWDSQVTVRVVYAYHCSVPIASRFFCAPESELPEAAVKDLHAANIKPGDGRFLILRAEHTLTKQGRPHPELNPRKKII